MTESALEKGDRDPPGKVNAPRWALIYAVGSGLIGLGELAAGLITGSMALIADSIHSITDVLAGLIGAISAAIAKREPDHNHPFGHSRAEPLGAFMVAVLTSLLGLNVLQVSISNLLKHQEPQHGATSYYAILAVLLFKGGFYLLSRSKRKSTMVRALSIDSRNDSLASSATLIVIFLSSNNFPWLDQIFAFVIGGIILYSGFQIARENAAMLMGEIPAPEFYEQVHRILDTFEEIDSFDEIRAHHVGPEIHLALNIRLSPELTLAEIHQIEHRVITALSSIEDLSDVFVHIEPSSLKTADAASPANNGKRTSDAH